MPDPIKPTISDPQSLVDAALSAPPIPLAQPAPESEATVTTAPVPETVVTPPEETKPEAETVPAEAVLPSLSPLTAETSAPTNSNVTMGDDTPLAFVIPPPSSSPASASTPEAPMATDPVVPPAPVSPPITTKPKKKKKMGIVIGGVLLLIVFVFGGVAGYQYITTGEIPMIAGVKFNQKNIISNPDAAIRQRERSGTCSGVDCIPDLVQQAVEKDPNYLKSTTSSGADYTANTTKVVDALVVTGSIKGGTVKDSEGKLITENSAIKNLVTDCGNCQKYEETGKPIGDPAKTTEFLDYLNTKNIQYAWGYLATLGAEAPKLYCEWIGGYGVNGSGQCTSGGVVVEKSANLHYPVSYATTLAQCIGKDSTGPGRVVCEHDIGGTDAIAGGNYNTIDCGINGATGKFAGGASYDYCAPQITIPDDGKCTDAMLNSTDLAQVYLNSPLHENANGTFIGCGTGGNAGKNCFCTGGNVRCLPDSGKDSCGAEFNGVYQPEKNLAREDATAVVSTSETPTTVTSSTPPTAENPVMACTGITSVPVTTPAPAVGGKLTFTCAGTVTPATSGTLSYKFRYSINSGSYVSMTNKTTTTAELTIAACGTYKVQCQACATLNGVLTCDPTWTGATP